MERVIIFHFHLFKNAGTSVDEILKRNFDDRWTTGEFKFWPYERNISEVINWIKTEKDKIAFSSHTARLFKYWELEKEGIKIIPVIFIRHPLVRINSAYEFERNKQTDVYTLATVIARNTNLKGYVEIRWFLPMDNQTKNFHVARLSDLFYGEEGDDFNKALMAIKVLPFVGLVEKFEDSLKRLKELVCKYIPEFHIEAVYENVQFDTSIGLKERLKMIRDSVGDEFYEKMILMNKEDIILWEKVAALYNFCKDE